MVHFNECGSITYLALGPGGDRTLNAVLQFLLEGLPQGLLPRGTGWLVFVLVCFDLQIGIF